MPFLSLELAVLTETYDAKWCQSACLNRTNQHACLRSLIKALGFLILPGDFTVSDILPGKKHRLSWAFTIHVYVKAPFLRDKAQLFSFDFFFSFLLFFFFFFFFYLNVYQL